MTDYRALSDAELDREVAERLGRKVLSWPGFHGGPVLIYADEALGIQRPEDLPPSFTPKGWDLYRKVEVVPKYSTDLNAAWTLLSEMDVEITLKSDPDGGMLIHFWKRVWHGAYLVGQKPARSMCVAWLEYRDWMTENGMVKP